MIFLQSNSILIEIQQIKYIDNDLNKQTKYLIGDQIYENLSKNIISNSFVSANWNRALKYKANLEPSVLFNNILEINIGFHKLSFDLYLNIKTMKIEILTKNNFDNKIISQEYFQNVFLMKIIDAYNKFKLENNTLISTAILENKIITFSKEKIQNINNFIVSNNFDITNKKYKWKKITILSNKNEIVKTKHGQLIYYVNTDEVNNEILKYIKFLDIKNSIIYVEGYVLAQKKLFINFNFEDELNTKKILNKIKDSILKIQLNPIEKELHLYNLTLDEIYLINMLNKFNNTDYKDTKKQLENIFSSISNNYYSEIFSNNNLKKIMFLKIKDIDDLIDYEKNVKRFGILQKNEVSEIKKMKKEFNS